MIFLLKSLEFLFSTIAIFFTWILVQNIIGSVINPQFDMKDGKLVEKNNNARLWFALIIAISWAFVIIIP